MELYYELGVLGLFLACFLAATIIPLASEALLIYLVNETPEEWMFLCLIATLGNVLGGMTSYYLGWLLKWNWLEKYFRINANKTVKWKEKAQKYGAWMALLTWTPIIGDLIAIALGLTKTNWKKVLLGMFIGKAIRYIVVLFPVIY